MSGEVSKGTGMMAGLFVGSLWEYWVASSVTWSLTAPARLLCFLCVARLVGLLVPAWATSSLERCGGLRAYWSGCLFYDYELPKAEPYACT